MGIIALAIPQSILEWTSFGLEEVHGSVKLWKALEMDHTIGPNSQTPRNHNSVGPPRRLAAGLTTESDPFRIHKNKNFGTSMRWSQYHGRLAVNSLSQIQALTYIRARKVKPIIIIIALAPHYSTTTIFGESSLCNHNECLGSTA